MAESNWYEIKFLESASNVKQLVKRAIGKTPSTKIAGEISVCLQQGRMFFETARSSPVQIRPLQIFYGILGFSKALVLARNITTLDTLPHTHGIRDVSASNSQLKKLAVRIDNNGTFQRFNDVVASLNRIHYFGKSNMPAWHLLPFTNSELLNGKELSFAEILARVPYLQHLYEKTFNEPAKTWHIQIMYWDEYDGYTDIRIDDPNIYTDRDSLKTLVNKWRSKFPFLKQWYFIEATHAWGNAIIHFCNVSNAGVDEFSVENLTQEGITFKQVQNLPQNDFSYKRIPFTEILQPIAGGITGSHQYAIEPYDGQFISEYSLHYLGMYLLSSLVRYRPQIWGHAISKSVTQNSPADDQALALIENFMDVVLSGFPRMVVESIGINLAEVSS